MSHPVLYEFEDLEVTLSHRYCIPLYSVTSRHNNHLWMKWRPSHNDVQSLDTLLTPNPVYSVKGELGGLAAIQTPLGKYGQLTALLKWRAGVLTEDTLSQMMHVSLYGSLCLYIAVT